MSVSISIVTPSLNQGRFLRQAVKSVLDQNDSQFELFVIDGGSTDDSLCFLGSQPGAVRWISEPDRGQADAVNKGFKLCNGDVIGWLNSDDLYCPGAFERVAKCFEEDPDLMLLYGEAHHVDESGNLIEKYPTREEFCLEGLATGCFICQPACFFRRSLLELAGPLDVQLQYAMDLDLWIRFGKLQVRNSQWKFQYLPKVLALSRMHEENKTLSKRRAAYLEIILVVEKHFGCVPFNWVYGLEEAADGRYDGFFRRSPLSFSLLARSVTRWVWRNRTHLRYVLRCLSLRLRSPFESANRLAHRTGARW